MVGGRGEQVIGAFPSAGPGVIVVADPQIYAALAASSAHWNVQERQENTAAMWQALSDGRLDSRSRILVFTDATGPSSAHDETAQVATAVAAMAGAGARVFVACTRPQEWSEVADAVARAARAQGIAADDVVYHRLDAAGDPQELIAEMARVLDGEVVFPSAVREPSTEAPVAPASVPVPVDQSSEVQAPAAMSVTTTPALPPIGGAAPTARSDEASEYPPNASMDLLAQPKRPGQVTITVTSSKGGSGKSTASILLAGTIARASAEAGRPLSVCLLDLDTRDGQVASLIGTFMPTALNIRVQPVWDEERIRRNLVRAPGIDIDTLLAPIRPRTADTVGPEFYRTIVRSLQRMFDVIVMDTSVQYLEPLIADVALVESDEVLFVTTLASTAIQGMARALREITAPRDESGLGIPREKIGIIVNQAVANVGMEREQVLAAGLGVPVVGVIPLATKDVLTATNLNRMHELLSHPVIGPAYNDLARACLPGRELAPWTSADGTPTASATELPHTDDSEPPDHKRWTLFRR